MFGDRHLPDRIGGYFVHAAIPVISHAFDACLVYQLVTLVTLCNVSEVSCRCIPDEAGPDDPGGGSITLLCSGKSALVEDLHEVLSNA